MPKLAIFLANNDSKISDKMPKVAIFIANSVPFLIQIFTIPSVLPSMYVVVRNPLPFNVSPILLQVSRTEWGGYSMEYPPGKVSFCSFPTFLEAFTHFLILFYCSAIFLGPYLAEELTRPC